MWTDVKVSDRYILAVVLGDIVDSLTHPISTIRSATRNEGIGEYIVTNDFLKAGEVSTSITQNRNSRRRKCYFLPAQTRSGLAGSVATVSCHLTYMVSSEMSY